MRISILPPPNIEERNPYFASLDTLQLRKYFEDMNVACSHHTQILQKATIAKAAAEREFRLRAMSS